MNDLKKSSQQVSWNGVNAESEAEVGKPSVFVVEIRVSVLQRLEEIVRLFRKNFGEATPADGKIRVCSKTIKVTTKWTLTDVDQEKRVSCDTISIASRADEKPTFKLIQPAKELNESMLVWVNYMSPSRSLSGNSSARVRVARFDGIFSEETVGLTFRVE